MTGSPGNCKLWHEYEVNSPVCETGGSKRSSQVSFQRHVPKFLQAHMHLLGKPAVGDGEPGQSVALDNKARQESDDEEAETAQVSTVYGRLCSWQ